MFVHDGKLKKQHEATHRDQTKKDDMLDYQSAFLEYGMLLRNFTDAISEGDGDRIIRCWKFFLLYLKKDGSTSRKYPLEALYLICQAKAILSPSAAYRLIWNRFYKSKYGTGGNIPLDLSNEHFNRILKTIARNVVHNAANPNVLARYCKALPVTKETLDNWDRKALFIKRSGKHFKQADEKDLRKIVAELMKQKAFKKNNGRSYKHFSQVAPSLLEGFDLHKMFTWINDHKKKIHFETTAR